MGEESTMRQNSVKKNNQKYNPEDQNSMNFERTTEELFDERILHQLSQILSDDPILVPSIQHPYENHRIQYPSDPFVLNQHSMYSVSRPIFNPAPELSFTMGQNLPQEGYNNVNSNRAVIFPTENQRDRGFRANYRRGRMPILRGSSSRSEREAIEREFMETNRQYQNAPRDPRRTLIPNSLYNPSYAEDGQSVDPFLRGMQLNSNFGNGKGNK